MSSNETQTPPNDGGDTGNSNSEAGSSTQGNNNGNNNNNSGNNNRNNNNNNRRNDNRRNLFSGKKRTWAGDKADVGAVIGLRTEYLDKKVSYRVFIEKMIEYVLRKVDDASDVLPILSQEKDPIPIFQAEQMPKPLTDEQKKNDVLSAIQTQRIKKYVDREICVETNVKRIYGLIKGQCSHSLRALLKQEKDYEDKDRQQDVLWLLKQLKKITSGLDSKSNKRCNLFDALYAFITMRQGNDESDSAYLKRFRVNVDTLCSAGGQHILCSPDLIETADKDNITEREKETEENKFKAIVFLKRSDPTRYGSFLTELQNSAHLGRDEYPVSETVAMDLMVRRSGVF